MVSFSFCIHLKSFFLFSFGPSDYAIPLTINTDEKQEILDVLNQYRGNVSSKYMLKLYWDDELAKLAQVRSNMCGLDNDLIKNRMSPLFGWSNGQAIVMTEDTRTSAANLLEILLSSEKVNFQYGIGCYQNSSSCLSYALTMLDDMTLVGCGQTHCLYPDRVEHILTCNYQFALNLRSYLLPYTPSKF